MQDGIYVLSDEQIQSFAKGSGQIQINPNQKYIGWGQLSNQQLRQSSSTQQPLLGNQPQIIQQQQQQQVQQQQQGQLYQQQINPQIGYPQQPLQQPVQYGNPGYMQTPGQQTVIIQQQQQQQQQQPQQPGQYYEAFYTTLPCLTGTYIFLLLACIVVQYLLCGALKAAQLWISSLVFLIVANSLVKVTSMYSRVYFLFVSMFFFSLQQVLEIAAFAIAVSHPPILSFKVGDYQADDQKIGSCAIYSDTSDPYIQNGYYYSLQYGCLALYVIQFLLSFFVTYNFGKKSWAWQRYLRSLTPQPVPGAQIIYPVQGNQVQSFQQPQPQYP